MQVTIAPRLCTGCGLCAALYPDLFAMVGEMATVRLSPVPPDRQEAVSAMIEDCPAMAIVEAR